LVYATCSLEPEENERVVEAVLSRVSRLGVVPRAELSRQFPAWSGFFSENGFLRTRPDRDGMDGFFAAVIEPRL
jgi:16S rRNA (cytosine967-C5)-methyltransferase